MPKTDDLVSYELKYGSGGHGGPYYGKDVAIRAAVRLLKGSASEQRIYIKNCNTSNDVLKLSKTEVDGLDAIRIAGVHDDYGDLQTIDLINPGDRFWHNGMLYMAIRPQKAGVLEMNAVRMSDGELCQFPAWETVNRTLIVG